MEEMVKMVCILVRMVQMVRTDRMLMEPMVQMQTGRVVPILQVHALQVMVVSEAQDKPEALQEMEGLTLTNFHFPQMIRFVCSVALTFGRV